MIAQIAIGSENWMLLDQPPSIRRDIEHWVLDRARTLEYRRREKRFGWKDSLRVPRSVRPEDHTEARAAVMDHVLDLVDKMRAAAHSDEYPCPCTIGCELEEDELYERVPRVSVDSVGLISGCTPIRNERGYVSYYTNFWTVRGADHEGDHVTHLWDEQRLRAGIELPKDYGRQCQGKVTIFEEVEHAEMSSTVISWCLYANGSTCGHHTYLDNLDNPESPEWQALHARWFERERLRELIESTERRMRGW